jgi:hypothetical protein
LLDIGRIGGQIDQLELKQGRLANQFLERLGVLDTRDLDQDAVAALGDDS